MRWAWCAVLVWAIGSTTVLAQPGIPLPAAPAAPSADASSLPRPVVAPLPDWVLEEPIPPSPGDAGDAAVAILLTD
ncbi:MAG: hypothetical protein ACK4TG_01730, partial [Thermaurantiacus sp.]